jgi:hypothetical protein
VEVGWSTRIKATPHLAAHLAGAAANTRAAIPICLKPLRLAVPGPGDDPWSTTASASSLP